MGLQRRLLLAKQLVDANPSSRTHVSLAIASPHQEAERAVFNLKHFETTSLVTLFDSAGMMQVHASSSSRQDLRVDCWIMLDRFPLAHFFDLVMCIFLGIQSARELVTTAKVWFRFYVFSFGVRLDRYSWTAFASISTITYLKEPWVCICVKCKYSTCLAPGDAQDRCCSAQNPQLE